MEPPGVIRLLRRGVKEGVRGGGGIRATRGGGGHIFEVDQSLRTVMGRGAFFAFCLFSLSFSKGSKRLCFM